MITDFNKKIITVSFIALTCSPLYAQEIQSNDLFSLSFEELLSVKVFSTTKTAEVALQKAPGIVRVFTRNMIKNQGYKTLKDILLQVPGIQVQEYRAGHQLAWSRGVQSRYNSKVLWLVDGVPIRDSYYGHNAIDEFIPLEYVERVEIINGPGSVLYGANAFAGVVSVTTKKSAKSLSISGGTHGTRSIGGQYGWDKGYGYFDSYSTDGFKPALKSNGEPFDHPHDADRQTAYISLAGEKFSGSLSLTDYEHTDTFRKSGRYRTHHRKPMILSARYQDSYENGGNLSALSYYEKYDYSKSETKFNGDGSIDSMDTEVLDTILYGLEMDYSQKFGEHTLVTGLSYQVDEENGIAAFDTFPDFEESVNLSEPGISRSTFGVFAQDMWDLSDTLTFT